MTTTTAHRIGTRDEWLAAREALLAREKEHTRQGDELARERRALPWVRVEQDYRFDTEDGERTLAELFDGRSQLLVYHFMFGPSYDAGDAVNSSIADTIDGLLPHLHARDVTFVLASGAPIEKLAAYRRRMGWGVPWVSTARTSFNVGPRLLALRGGRSRRRRADDRERGDPADRRAQRSPRRDGRRRLHDREPGLQLLRPRGRRGLPHVLDHVARPGVPDGLLPDPGPRAEGPRRGRRDWQLWLRRHDEY